MKLLYCTGKKEISNDQLASITWNSQKESAWQTIIKSSMNEAQMENNQDQFWRLFTSYMTRQTFTKVKEATHFTYKDYTFNNCLTLTIRDLAIQSNIWMTYRVLVMETATPYFVSVLLWTWFLGRSHFVCVDLVATKMERQIYNTEDGLLHCCTKDFVCLSRRITFSFSNKVVSSVVNEEALGSTIHLDSIRLWKMVYYKPSISITVQTLYSVLYVPPNL